MAVHLNLADEHTHTHLPHGTNILLVPLWLLHPKAIDLQKTPTASREEDLPGAQQKAGTQLTSVSSISSFPIAAGEAGDVKHCLHAWGAITTDLSILAMIEFGVTSDFIGLPPVFSPTVSSFPSVNLPGIAEDLLNLGHHGFF